MIPSDDQDLMAHREQALGGGVQEATPPRGTIGVPDAATVQPRSELFTAGLQRCPLTIQGLTTPEITTRESGL
jgi:hypothetical protein